jgi:hypothetical protein
LLAQTAADAETNALRAALFFEQQAEDFESAGRVALTQGILGAGTTILGGAETFRNVAGSIPGRKTKISTARGGFSTESIAGFGKFA